MILFFIYMYSTMLLGAMILVVLIVRSAYKTHKSNCVDFRTINGSLSTFGRYWSSTLYFASGYLIALKAAKLIPLLDDAVVFVFLFVTILCAVFTEVAALNDSRSDKLRK